jgi:hypothetical protein
MDESQKHAELEKADTDKCMVEVSISVKFQIRPSGALLTVVRRRYLTSTAESQHEGDCWGWLHKCTYKMLSFIIMTCEQ